jgi:N-acetylglutamate synthase
VAAATENPRGLGVRYRYEVRIGPEDVGRRVVVRWRRPAPGGGDEVADVVGPLEAAGDEGFAVRNRRGELVRIPRERALAAKVVPPR